MLPLSQIRNNLPTRRPMIHLKIILCMVRIECWEHVFHNSIKFFPYNFLIKLTWPHLNSLAVLLKINWCYMCGFISEMSIPFRIFIWLSLIQHILIYYNCSKPWSQKQNLPILFFFFEVILFSVICILINFRIIL